VTLAPPAGVGSRRRSLPIGRVGRVGRVGVIAVAALAASLAGCTGGEPEPAPAPTPSATSAAPPRLEIAVHGERRKLAAYREIVEAFQVEQTDVEVRLTTFPDELSSADALAEGLADGTAPDVFLADVGQLPRLLETRGLQPVDSMLEEQGIAFGDDYQRVGLTAFSANARLQCMPAEVSPLVVYYNKRLVNRSQVPEPIVLPNTDDPNWEWAEFEALARAVAGIDRLGPVSGAWYPADVETLTAFLRSAGSEVVDDVVEPSSLNLTSDDAVEVVTALASLARDPGAFPVGAERDEAVDLFAAGRLGLLVGTREDLPRLRAADRLRFDVLPLPTFGRVRSVSSMSGWCVSDASRQGELVGEFIAYAVGAEASAIAARSGAIVPSGLDSLYDRSFTQPRQQPRSSHVYAAAIRRSDPMPFSAAWPAVSAEVEEALGRLYTRAGIELGDALLPRLEELNAMSVELFSEPVD
jgi:multiple sugar transport system substrate-binding protein